MSDQAEVYLRQAQAARAAQRFDEAAQAYSALLAIRPNLPDTWFNLALMLRGADRPIEALEAYDEALGRQISGPEEVHVNRAVIYSDDLARPLEARAELEKALQIRPDYLPALLNLGNLHEDQGERDDALAVYAQALSVARPEHRALPLARLANATRFEKPDDPLISRLRDMIARPGLSAGDQAELGFALGRALDEVADYEAAFSAYDQANAASRAATGARYDRQAHEAFVAASISAFAACASRPSSGSKPGSSLRPPVFILGMFRSGSTLVERILAAHTGVVAGGEMAHLPRLAAGIENYPMGAAAASDETLLTWREAYLKGVSTAHGHGGLITDKRPDNFLHVGLIKALFPEALIIHTVRDPRDVCLSSWFLHLDASMAWAFDLEDAAHWLKAHDRLMAHWKGLYPDILTVSYDALVGDLEAQSRRLVEYCGLDWEPQVLDFHAAGGAVRTASVWQIRQPIYRRSSGRWRNYENRIAGLVQALG
jgi:tetratricopeptide (TPR) repeat protein